MMVLITYDVETLTPSGRKRLRQVAKQCVNFGQRVQNSVFECLIDPSQFAELKHRLESIADKQKDSLRYYKLGNNWQGRIEQYGIKTSYNPEDTMII
jgi:CRISPR-associated protein Cas2